MTDEPNGSSPLVADGLRPYDREADEADEAQEADDARAGEESREVPAGEESHEVGGPAAGESPEERHRRDRGRDRRRSRRNRIVAVVVAASITLVVAVLVMGGWFLWQVYEPFGGGPSSDSVPVVVEPGWSTSQVADALVDADVIDSALAFRIWTRVQGATFQAGTYSLHPGRPPSARRHH